MHNTFPIKFKHYRIERGVVSPESTTDLPIDGYVMLDNDDVYVAGSRSLASLVILAANRDISAEEAQQFIDRQLPTQKHLEGIDIDRRPDPSAGIMVPGYMAQGSEGGSGGPRSH